MLCISMLTFNSCATVNRAHKQSYVSIYTNPSDADITIINRRGQTVFEGRTPTFIYLNGSCGYMRREKYDIYFEKDGYHPKAITIKAKLNGWYIGNIWFSGWIGFLIVDPLSGAMFEIPKDESLIIENLHRKK